MKALLANPELAQLITKLVTEILEKLGVIAAPTDTKKPWWKKVLGVVVSILPFLFTTNFKKRVK